MAFLANVLTFFQAFCNACMVLMPSVIHQGLFRTNARRWQLSTHRGSILEFAVVTDCADRSNFFDVFSALDYEVKVM
jgi:hypothetical protein